MKRFCKESLHATLESKTGRVGDLRRCYRDLCDIPDVRGTPKVFRTIQPSDGSFSGRTVLEHFEEELERSLDSFVDTIRYIALLLALSNPVLLFGLPLEEKCGINVPVSGFFADRQAERLRALIPKRHRAVLVSLAEKVGYGVGVRECFSSLPEMTLQEVMQQLDDFLGGFPESGDLAK